MLAKITNFSHFIPISLKKRPQQFVVHKFQRLSLKYFYLLPTPRDFTNCYEQLYKFTRGRVKHKINCAKKGYQHTLKIKKNYLQITQRYFKSMR